MHKTDRTPFVRSCTAALLLALCASVSAQANLPKLAPAYEGYWKNLEFPVTSDMSITIDKLEPDGSVTGTFSRAARYCATRGTALKGKLTGNVLEIVPDFSAEMLCKDTRFTLQVQPDGSLAGEGESYFKLRVVLKPVAK